MNLTINLDAEQSASLQARVDELNATAKPETPFTQETYLLRSLSAEVASYVATDFQVAVNRIAAAAKALPFEQRITLITQIESQIP